LVHNFGVPENSVQDETIVLPENSVNVFNVHGIEIAFRLQRSKTCFMQAPAALQCYMLQIGTREFKGMVNISKYVRTQFGSEELSKYLLEDNGGDSFTMMKNLLPTGFKKFEIFDPVDVAIHRLKRASSGKT